MCHCGDYGSKKRVKEHNKAMDKIYNLKDELNNPEGEEILLRLLFHENGMVVLNAAMLCLELNFHKKEKKERVIYVKDSSKDPLIQFNAETMLKFNFRS